MFFVLWSVAFGQSWNETIDRVVKSVVILKYDRPRAFDGMNRGSPQASGFVVDAERGIVLTNRHVVGSAPLVAMGIFHDKEEVSLTPIYRDPVHDFGFLQYDPAALRHIEPISLELSPESALVGTEIRLIGNDAAEQISILDATLSRVDRDAPWWDMNTFYLQAASDSSGGSSGSPLFDVQGRVIALNSGGRNKESTSYYLPLDRIKVALTALQDGQVPSRGSLMTEFRYRTYDELRRLGLSPTAEEKAREGWAGTGLLTVQTVGVGGVAEDKLQPGDILLGVNGEPIYGFQELEAFLDEHVGDTLSLEVERGGVRRTEALSVADLHKMEPTAFASFGGAIVHDVGYRRTVRVNRPPTGVILADTGDWFYQADIPKGSILEAVGEEPTPDLASFEKAFSKVRKDEVVAIRYSSRKQVGKSHVARLRRTASVWPSEHCERTGTRWSCEPLTLSTAEISRRQTAVRRPPVHHRSAQAIARRLVTVASVSEFPLDSVYSSRWKSAGLIVDPVKGLVLTDRYGVPNAAAKVRIQAGNAPSIPAEIVWLDPLYNVALVQYDPHLLSFDEGFEPLEFSDKPFSHKRKLYGAFLDGQTGAIHSEPMSFVKERELTLSKPRAPRYRPDNMMTYDLGSPADGVLGGPVVDRSGKIVALFQRFYDERKGSPRPKLLAVSPHYAQEAMAGRAPLFPGIDVRLMSLVEAAEAGLPREIVSKIELDDPEHPHVLEVWQVDGNQRAPIRVGDIVLKVNGISVNTFYELQSALSLSSTLTVVRNGNLREIALDATPTNPSGTQEAVLWAGAWIQEEPLEVARDGGTPKEGVYVSWYYGGSPAGRYGLGWGRRLIAIDDTEVHSLADFLGAVQGREDRSSVRIRLQDLRGDEAVITLRLDNQWWPLRVIERENGEWVDTKPPEPTPIWK